MFEDKLIKLMNKEIVRKKSKWENPVLIAKYTDGTEVKEGDKIRYKQQPGGILPPNKDWMEGIAGKCPWDESGTLYLVSRDRDRYTHYHYFHIFSHIIEKIQ